MNSDAFKRGSSSEKDGHQLASSGGKRELYAPKEQKKKNDTPRHGRRGTRYDASTRFVHKSNIMDIIPIFRPLASWWEACRRENRHKKMALD